MKLKKITIENFRSMENISLNIQEIAGKTCLIFLGINESGKSNILQAVALRHKDRKCDYNVDCNKTARKKGKSILITYDLEISNNSFYKKQFIEYGIDKNLASKIRITRIQRKVEIDKENGKRNFFHVWISDNKEFSKYLIDKQNKTIKAISDVYTDDEQLSEDNINQVIGANYKFLDKVTLETFLEDKLFNLFELNTPNVVFWKPSKEYLINEPVHLGQFKDNLNLSIPLRNIFKILGVDKIEDRIDLISNDAEERIQLAEELTKSTTEYINKRWPEHKVNLKIVIDENLSCSVMVEDKDNLLPKYKMTQRSDGFKQFVSILLNLSAESETGLLSNKIVILDEPEVHLHPSGVRYLRDALLKISRSNVVLIATHSIYMVDRLNLGRHYKVEKDNAVTSILQIKGNNPYQEEVIYESLGSSIYELIEPNMIIFEGKTDKDIFDAFTKKFKTDFKPVKLGTISADGVQRIRNYTKFFNNKLVKGFVLVDSDKEGKGVKETVLKEKNYNKKNTFEINDITNIQIAATLEDLFPNKIVLVCTKKRYNLDIVLDDSSDKKPIIEQVKTALKNSRKIGPKDKLEDLKSDIAMYILNDISRKNKKKTKEKYASYFDFIDKLHKKLKKVS